MKKLSKVNGKATNLNKPLTFGTVEFILNNAGKMSANNIAAVIHRPVKTVRNVASRFGISLQVL